MILYSTDASFNVDISGVLPVLVVFVAEWCGPCRILSPIIDEVEKEYSDQLTIVKVDIDKCLSIPSKYNVRGVPTCILMQDSKELSRAIGSVKANLINMLNKKL
jgi:thioredoxin 1